jgi:hypothetical protein
MGRYVYDQAWEQERERLLGMARLWDTGTFAIFERLRVGAGWRCLEIGFGRRLPSELRAAGLVDVEAEGRVRVFAGGTAETAFSRLTLTAMRQRVVDSSALDADRIDRAIAACDDPGRTFLSGTMIACWGRAR